MNPNAEPGDPLTPREKQVLQQIVKGRVANKHIAYYLGISQNTVKTHLKNSYLKLDAHNKIEAILEAKRRGELDF